MLLKLNEYSAQVCQQFNQYRITKIGYILNNDHKPKLFCQNQAWNSKERSPGGTWSSQEQRRKPYDPTPSWTSPSWTTPSWTTTGWSEDGRREVTPAWAQTIPPTWDESKRSDPGWRDPVSGTE